MDVKSVNVMLFEQELHDHAEFLLQITYWAKQNREVAEVLP